MSRTSDESGFRRARARSVETVPSGQALIARRTAPVSPAGAVQSAAKGGLPARGPCGAGGEWCVAAVIPTTAAAAPAALNPTTV